MMERLGGAKVEYGAAGGLPAASVIEEDRGGMAQVADGLDALHVAAFDGFEANGDGDQCGELTCLPVAREGDFRVPITGHPPKAAWFAAAGGGAQKLVGQ